MDKPTELVRLHYREYEKLEQMMPKPIISDKDTELKAGYLLGIQHVLKVLRDGWKTGA